MEKWRVELQKRRGNTPGAAELSRDRTPLGRVVVIDHYVPEPDQDSGSVRMHALLGLLRKQGYAVTFVPDNRHRSEPYTSDLQQLGVEVFYGDQALEEHLTALEPEICAVIVSRPSVAWRYMAMLREVLPEAPVFYDTVDLHHQREEARSALEARSGTGITKAWRELELGLVRSCDATFVVSTTEQQVLQQEVPDADIRLLPNVHVPVPDAPGPAERQRELLFVGGYRHHPNIDAVQWFVSEVLPRVKRAAPDVRVTVVGSNPPPSVTELDGNGVDVLGWVQDLDPLLARARVFIAPLRYGAGIKGKVGQSLSHGLPVVTTSVGADGMGLQDGVHARVADDAQGFARAVVDLLDDDAQWLALASAGRKLVDERFGPTAVERLLDEAFLSANVDRTRGRD
jgi:glycosyltransferase involved in cell wall biosynthesis